MQLLVVHLSDLHIVDSNNPVLGRISSILSSIRSLEVSTSHIVLAVTGDLTYSGSEAQFSIATDFLRSLASQLPTCTCQDSPELVVSVHIVAVPGNHDCDFSGLSEQARSLIVKPVLSQSELAHDSDHVALCLEVQRNYFTFLHSIQSPEPEPVKNDVDTRLAYQYAVGVDKQITFQCYNTAWLSQLHEIPGHLYFPTTAIASTTATSQLVISLVHHPLQWLQPPNARSIREALLSGSDFVLTGHEHISGRFSHTSEVGDSSVILEASALHDTEAGDASAFTTVLIDLDDRQHRVAHHVWDGHLYVPRAGLQPNAPHGQSAWEPLPTSPLRHAGHFVLSPTLASRLDDLGVLAAHRRRGLLRLSDIFVYPDLREVPPVPDRNPAILRGEHTVAAFREHRYLLITGPAQAGKTSLAKTIFRELHGGGDVPLFLDGSQKLPSGPFLTEFITRQFTDQYSPQALEQYKQLPRDRRVIVIDDFHKQHYSQQQTQSLLQRLTAWAGRVLILADDLSMATRDLSTPATAASFKRYHILPFGHVRRNSLVEKWLLLDRTPDDDAVEFARQLANVQRTFETLIGRNFVPAYPAYILAVLQATEAATPIDTSASTHGYFYELLIKTRLASAGSRQDFDIVMAYLGFLAYSMYSDRTHVVDALRFSRIHNAYCAKYAVDRKHSTMLDLLLKLRVLIDRDAGYGFTYKYIYYYFVAAYLRDHIGEGIVQTHIRDMAATLYKDESANVLLFLAHLSKDPSIIAELLSAGRAIIATVQPFSFGEDGEFLRHLGSEVPALTYEHGQFDGRKEMLESLDDTEPPPDGALEPQPDGDLPPEALSDPLVQFSMALKAMQILGQVVKNFPGSLEASKKTELVRECCGLGLRALGLVYGLIRSNQTEFMQFIASVQKQAHPRLLEQDLAKKAAALLAIQARLIGFGIVKAISASVGSKELGRTYNELFALGESPALTLVHCSLELDHGTEVPEVMLLSKMEEWSTNPPPIDILRMLVLHHFYMFPVDYQTKQRLCQKLGISITSVKNLDPAQRLLPQLG
jgi:predicted MPP superfamily phosphohydrolase